MKKLILAGIVIIICCLVFLIVKQNTSRADIGMDIYDKPYLVPFGQWVLVWTKIKYTNTSTPEDYYCLVSRKRVEGKTRYVIKARYNRNTEYGRSYYQIISGEKENLRLQCKLWTAQGYPISLNDIEFDIQEMQ
jgi:hypothetical protein